MSITLSFTQSIAALPLVAVVRSVAGLSLLAGLGILFKPLLTGLIRAAWLLIHPRLTKDQLLARRNMRDAAMLERMIKETSSPSLAAELRAMGARC